MLEDIYPVQWAGQQAVLSLPEHIDEFNAGQIQDELLLVVDRGAKVLIADMTATISCGHAGADAVVRVFQQAVISGTELRLAVTAQFVRRMLSLSGVDRLVSIYPSLEAATAAGGVPAEVLALVARPPQELLDTVITRLFHVGLSLQTTTDLPAEMTRQRIAEALGHLDDTIREIRDTAFTTCSHIAFTTCSHASAPNLAPLNDAG